VSIHTYADLLKQLLDATTSAGVKDILTQLGDRSDLNLDESFGPFALQWHAFGNNPSNLSTIGLGAKPGRSFTERLTNATDALLEDRYVASVTPPTSARLAAKQWFGRPLTGPDEGLFKWPGQDPDLARRIEAILLDSGVASAPTIDVFDEGIGIVPEEFTKTILSLQGGNKIKKWYLIGAFGQGGASTLAFCDYVLILSRSKHRPTSIAFTVVRALNLNETYKEDCWGYLCLMNAAGQPAVPFIETNAEAFELYSPVEKIKLPFLTKGTLVRHYTYKLTNLEKQLGPSPGNLYHYLHFSMFDPLLPFRLIDLRLKTKERDEIIRGSRNRLMLLAEKGTPDSIGEDTGSQLRHYRPMEYITPLGFDDSSIGVEYWVVFSYRTRKEKASSKAEIVLRSSSNDLFVQAGHPIVGTLNGQNQGELTSHLLRDLGLSMVARHIIVHIDATNANSRVRRELFSTNREGFKDGPILQDLTRVLKKMLEEDETLQAIERELTETLAKREVDATNHEVKRQVTRLLLEAGLQLSEEGPAYGKGNEDKQPVRSAKRRTYRKQEPLPTLPFPQVTRFEIVSPKPELECRLHDTEIVLVETNADIEFDRKNLIAIRSEPPSMELAAKAPLKGGRLRWRVRPIQGAEIGTNGRVVVTITKPDGTQITDEVPFTILEPLEEKSKKEKGFVPPFDIIPVNPHDDIQTWGLVWPDLTEDSPPSQLEAVAYKPVRVGGAINVYYSTIFSAFKSQVDKLKTETSVLSDLFRTNYEVWIGYHAILQEQSRNDQSEIDPEVLERLLETDRVRVAQMQVRQASRTAVLMQESIRAQTAAAESS
jgi:hypothetical protein